MMRYGTLMPPSCPRAHLVDNRFRHDQHVRDLFPNPQHLLSLILFSYLW
jgi:hypothetical protein